MWRAQKNEGLSTAISSLGRVVAAAQRVVIVVISSTSRSGGPLLGVGGRGFAQGGLTQGGLHHGGQVTTNDMTGVTLRQRMQQKQIVSFLHTGNQPC